MATIRFENTIRIRRPVGSVFEFVANPENIPKWNYFVLDVAKTSEGKLGVGSTFHQVRKSDTQDLRIEAYDVNRRVTMATVPPSKPQLERELIFETHGEETRIVDTWSLELFGLERLASRKVQSAVMENLQKLRQLLETGSVRLQDGRCFSL